MNSPILAGMEVLRALQPVFRELHRSGQDDVANNLIVSGIIGGLFSIPALIVAGRKNLPLGGIFWVNAIAGAIGDFPLAIVSGIVTLIYACVRMDSRERAALQKLKPQGSNGSPSFVILMPLIGAVACLVVLPYVFTSSVTTVLPDHRTWLEKLRGDPVPTSTEDVTNWLPVIVVTLIVSFVSATIGSGIDETNRLKSRGAQANPLARK